MAAIVLYHKSYNEQHLAAVKSEMERRGAPVIRCIWSEMHGLWLAVEGCHRIRAARALGLTPIVKDVSGQKQVQYQQDGESIRTSVAKLTAELNDNAPHSIVMDFEGAE